MSESKLLLALFCNKKLTKTVRGVVVVVFSVRFGCVTLMVTLQYYGGGECGDSHIHAQVLSISACKWDQQVARAPKNSQFKFKIKRKYMFQIFEIQGKRFEYSNNIRAQKLSNPNPNIRDSRKKIRIRIESEYIRSSLI